MHGARSASARSSGTQVIIGRFICFDKQQNVLVNEAREIRMLSAVEGDVPEKSERHLGIVLVPRKWVHSCHGLANE